MTPATGLSQGVRGAVAGAGDAAGGGRAAGAARVHGHTCRAALRSCGAPRRPYPAAALARPHDPTAEARVRRGRRSERRTVSPARRRRPQGGDANAPRRRRARSPEGRAHRLRDVLRRSRRARHRRRSVTQPILRLIFSPKEPFGRTV